MKKNVFILFCLIAWCSSSVATTISISGTTVYKSDGSTLLPQGSYISVGYFGSSFSNFSGLSSRTWADITSTDYTEVFNSTVSPAGEASGSGTGNGILNETLYVWFFDSNATPTNVSSQEYGLYTGSDANWTASGDNIFSDFNFLDINIIDSAVFGSDLGPSSISLQAVPEPSTFAALSGFFALTWVMLRRRRA
jgi:hypothetical protein